MSNKERYLQAKQAALVSIDTREWNLRGKDGLVITQLNRTAPREAARVKPGNYAAHISKLNSFEQSFCNK